VSDEIDALIAAADRAVRELEAAVAEVRDALDFVPGEVPPSWRPLATHAAPMSLQ